MLRISDAKDELNHILGLLDGFDVADFVAEANLLALKVDKLKDALLAVGAKLDNGDTDGYVDAINDSLA